MHHGFHESEEGYRLLFESNPHSMWIYDRATLAFLAVNDAAIARYGYSRDEFLRMTLKDIRPAEDLPWLLERVAAIKPGMNSACSRHLKKDGTTIKVEIVSHTIQFNGKQAELVLAMDAEIAKSNAVPANAHAPSDFQDGQLTAAERRIARYVAYGFSNKQISTYLGISVRTVENHISHILGKKRFTNRVEIARHVLKDSRNESEMDPQVRFSNGPVHGDRL